MSDLPAIAGIGGTFELDGQVWTWSPLTVGIMAEFEAELREILGPRLNTIAQAKAACDEARLTGDDRKHVLERAVVEHVALQALGPFELLERFQVPDANACMLRRCLLKHHPNLKLDDVKGMIASRVVGQVFAMMFEQFKAALPGKGTSPSFAASSA